MKLVFIYGPPAAGKLTVAQELAKMTGYKLLHNHSTLDLIEEVIDFGSEGFFDLNTKIRMLILEAAAKSKVKGVIFTFCYANNLATDRRFVRNTRRIIKKYKGEVLFVQLYCHQNALTKRVVGKSRKKFGKIKDKKLLHKTLKKWELFTPIPRVKSYSVDNTKIPAKKVALMIKKHYKLK